MPRRLPGGGVSDSLAVNEFAHARPPTAHHHQGLGLAAMSRRRQMQTLAYTYLFRHRANLLRDPVVVLLV